MDDEKALGKIMDSLRTFAVVLLLLNFYFYCHGFFQHIHWTAAWSDNILAKFATKTPLFAGSYVSKLAALVCLMLSCIGTRGKLTEEVRGQRIALLLVVGTALLFGSDLIRGLPLPALMVAPLYGLALLIGFLMTLRGGNMLSRLLNVNLMSDIFNEDNESFPQEDKLMENEYSVNIPTEYKYRGKKMRGMINIVNPFRATVVYGTPGSGKSFAVINPFIKQHLAKGFAMYVYDFKFPDLSQIVYNELLKNQDKYKVPVQFYVINFDDPRRSHRCNPLLPSMMTDIMDAYEASTTIMLNLNKKWIEKQGEFFVESPINFVAAIIWFLKLYEGGKYCTFPHMIEFLSRRYEEMFPILGSYPEIENYVQPFVSAFENEAMEQLEGQIASARIALSRLASPQLYWVMSSNDFTLDVNNPEQPKVLCMANNPDRKGIYGAALSLYNSRILKLVNKKNKLKMSIIIDELPTMYMRGLDDMIATARSNKVATCLGIQTKAQLDRDYGKPDSTALQEVIGNLVSGQVTGDSAEMLSKRFGKILQKRQSVSVNSKDTSTSTSTQLDSMIPASKISNLTQGTFVGAVADNFDEEISQKVFHAKILVDVKAIQKETKAYQDIPEIKNFVNPATGKDETEEVLRANYKQIKDDVRLMCERELARIEADPELRHLIKTKKAAA